MEHPDGHVELTATSSCQPHGLHFHEDVDALKLRSNGNLLAGS